MKYHNDDVDFKTVWTIQTNQPNEDDEEDPINLGIDLNEVLDYW